MSEVDSKAVATQAAGGAVAAYDYGKYAGAGFENTTAADFKPSFLKILHGGSPLLEQVNGAKPGIIIDTVTKDLYPEILFVPAVHEHVMCAWVPRSPDGSGSAGFGGVYQLNDPAIQAALKAAPPFQRGEDGKMVLPTIEKEGVLYELVETRYFHGVQILPNGAQVPASLTFYSTGLNTAKEWLSMLQRQMTVLPNGRSIPLPLFAHVTKLGVTRANAVPIAGTISSRCGRTARRTRRGLHRTAARSRRRRPSMTRTRLARPISTTHRAVARAVARPRRRGTRKSRSRRDRPAWLGRAARLDVDALCQ
jgi:hypothetical protein